MSGYDPDAEVIGKYILAFIESAGEVSPVFESKVRSKFEENTGEIRPDEWYTAEDVKRTYESILADVGPKTMKNGGIETAKALPFEEDNSVAEALDLLCEEHTSSEVYRNTASRQPAGQYTYEVNGRSAHLGATEDYPYTKPFVEGIYRGLIRKYGTGATPEFEETTPRPDEGFAWHVEW
ncbi:hypothetical protein SAMN05216226_10687 [Halovenus aranensis]|jgi:hypothetical protein|uniref:Uncharacterized protein n=1 Tax=Halovenus aranensis TaxID=890420 RepID=A0A1G8VCE1_9EURY|nr:hypothetical protein [Halovenus aranensis]SDJ62800.1 hypothetical protein SAMN05216226_10687 [Halovenus aranensis]